MGKNNYLIVVLLITFVFYFFLFPFKVKEEFILVPQKKIDMSQGPNTPHFVSSQRTIETLSSLGYLDEEGNLTYAFDRTNRSRLSEKYFIQETPEGSLLLGSSETGQITTIETDLIPFLQDNRIFLADMFSGYFSELNREGVTLWDYSLPSLITAVDSRMGLTVLGLLNGEIWLFDNQGNKLFSWAPGGSRIDGVYGIALSTNGNYLAMICGLDPQRFILLEKKENGYRPIFHENLTHEFRRNVAIDFSHPFKLIAEGNKQGLYYTQNEPALISFDLGGDYVDSHFYKEDGTISFSVINNAKGGLLLFTEDGQMILDHTFDDLPLSMSWMDDTLLMANGNGGFLLKRGFY